MNLEIKDILLTNTKSRPMKKLLGVRAIIMHWTANKSKGANALANRNYFDRPDVQASAHYIVDSTQIIRCVPDDEVAYHVGAKTYAKIGDYLKISGYSPNFSTIGIEMCVNVDGDLAITQDISAKLAAKLLLENNLTIDDLYRHYDVTGKNCPDFLINTHEWQRFRDRVMKYYREFGGEERNIKTVNTQSSSLNVRNAPNTTTSSVLCKINKGTRVEVLEEKDGWSKIGYGWVSSKYLI